MTTVKRSDLPSTRYPVVIDLGGCEFRVSFESARTIHQQLGEVIENLDRGLAEELGVEVQGEEERGGGMMSLSEQIRRQIDGEVLP